MGHTRFRHDRCAIFGKHYTLEDGSDGIYKLGALFFTHPTSRRFRFSTLCFTTLSQTHILLYQMLSLRSIHVDAFATGATCNSYSRDFNWRY